jgi:hypothetical protein
VCFFRIYDRKSDYVRRRLTPTDKEILNLLGCIARNLLLRMTNNGTLINLSRYFSRAIPI